MRRILTVYCLILVGALLGACDFYTNVSAPDATINVTGTVTPAPEPPTQNPEPGSTNLMDPPSDTDVPFNEDDATSGSNAEPQEPPAVTPPVSIDTCQDSPGRGGGTGAPGNGKGRGDEQRGCAR